MTEQSEMELSEEYDEEKIKTGNIGDINKSC